MTNAGKYFKNLRLEAPILTDGGHDGDGEEQRLREGPVVGPGAGRVVAVLVVVVNHELLQTFQVSLHLNENQHQLLRVTNNHS